MFRIMFFSLFITIFLFLVDRVGIMLTAYSLVIWTIAGVSSAVIN